MTPTQFYHATEQARGVSVARARVRRRMALVMQDGSYECCDVCYRNTRTHGHVATWQIYRDHMGGFKTVCSECLDEYVAEEAEPIVGAAASGRLLDGVEHLDTPAGGGG